MKKKILLTIIVLGLMTGCGKVPKLANGEEAVVSFTDSKLSISATDLYNELKDKYALNVLIDMIDRKVLLTEYPDEESNAKAYVKEELDKVKKYYVDDNNKYDEASLINDLISRYGISTIEEFEKLLNISYYRTLAIDDYAKNQITDKQVESYYKTDIFGDIECSHILIIPDATDSMTDEEKTASEAAALKKAKDIIKELNDGAKFADLAKKHSEDESTAADGGALKAFNKGDMVSEFETAAYDLKLNTYTKEPVKTKLGYHIILKTAEKDKAPLADVKEEIISTLASELKSSDVKLSINAIVDLRKSYGINIADSDINSKYSTYVSNQLLSAQSNS